MKTHFRYASQVLGVTEPSNFPLYSDGWSPNAATQPPLEGIIFLFFSHIDRGVLNSIEYSTFDRGCAPLRGLRSSRNST